MGPVKEGARILVMDDDDSVLDVTSEILQSFGYLVEVARDGEETVAKYRHALQEGRRYDLVIMDLTVPSGMGGREAIVELRKIDPLVKAVVTSGHVTDPAVSRYREHGFVGMLPKPYRMDELGVMVKRALEA